MAKYNTTQLLDSLAADLRKILWQIEHLGAYTDVQLREKPSKSAWSVVEVAAHLNFYAQYYVPAIEEYLDGHQTQAQIHFKPGILGNYFTKINSASPDGQVRNKMKTLKEARPLAPTKLDPKTELKELAQHQHQLLNLIQIARTADLGRIKVPISITKFIKMKLGDTFRFVIAHEQRHFQQIERVLRAIEVET